MHESLQLSLKSWLGKLIWISRFLGACCFLCTLIFDFLDNFAANSVTYCRIYPLLFIIHKMITMNFPLPLGHSLIKTPFRPSRWAITFLLEHFYIKVKMFVLYTAHALFNLCPSLSLQRQIKVIYVTRVLVFYGCWPRF